MKHDILVVHPVMGSSVQQRNGDTGASPADSHKDNYVTGASVVGGEAERAGNVQTGEEKLTSH